MTKVMEAEPPLAIVEAMRYDILSINRAWLWRNLSYDQQLEELRQWQNLTSRALKRAETLLRPKLLPSHVHSFLSTRSEEQLHQIDVRVVHGNRGAQATR